MKYEKEKYILDIGQVKILIPDPYMCTDYKSLCMANPQFVQFMQYTKTLQTFYWFQSLLYLAMTLGDDSLKKVPKNLTLLMRLLTSLSLSDASALAPSEKKIRRSSFFGQDFRQAGQECLLLSNLIRFKWMMLQF